MTTHGIDTQPSSHVPLWQPVFFAALAGGMGWGIRGQYGHETGAMIAGLLVSLVLTFLLCPRLPMLSWARAVALGTVAMGFGGSMTYGQTVGLTHDAPLTGDFAPLSWGMLGLAIKGAIWIGFAGAFLGIGLSGERYRAREVFGLMLAMLGAYYIGVRLINGPFDPAERELPILYFSDHWRWEPDAELEPRREQWGGLLLALGVVIAYAGWWRKDRLARRLALWGMLGGLGFPIGQSLQAFHAWNPDVFDAGIWSRLDPHMNWWNMMEITFGAVMGAMLGLGLWLNRGNIGPPPPDKNPEFGLPAEVLLLAIHLPMLFAVAFRSYYTVDALYDLGLIMGIIPMVAIVGGRWWPYLVMFPITLMPIAGKTLRQLGYREEAIGLGAGWAFYVVVPLLLATVVAIMFGRRNPGALANRRLIGAALLFNAWLLFLLNYAFFRFPWPWADWTGRTPSGIIFTICILGLTIMVVAGSRDASPPGARPASSPSQP